MSIKPNWMRGRKERSAHLEDDKNYVNGTAKISHTDAIEETHQKLPKLDGCRKMLYPERED